MAATVAKMIDQMNLAVHNSPVGRYFEFEERKATFSAEIRGATATFMSMAYILAVNPRILADSGGPCVPNEDDGGIFGATYLACQEQIKREFVTSTALASMFGSMAMGLLANLPVALAPGMGMNAYFTYSVVGWRGTGDISYEAAVTAVFIEGFIFAFLALTGIRHFVTKLIPEPVRIATPAAIGFFLAHLGLQTAEGIGIVVSDIATAVTLGACPEDKRTPMVAYTETCETEGICTFSDAYTCDVLGGVMTSATTWVGILGLMIMAIMLAYRYGLSRHGYTCLSTDRPPPFFSSNSASPETNRHLLLELDSLPLFLGFVVPPLHTSHTLPLVMLALNTSSKLSLWNP
jgi:adenine/guanine/hypoxanthine permease